MKKCSFCGLSIDFAERFIEGQNNVFICNKCVDKCYNLLHKNSGSKPKIDDNSESKKEQSQTAQKIQKEERTLSELLQELNNLIGLQIVKNEVSTIISQIKIKKAREEKGLSQVPTSNHLVFMGNPGTGKTTVARLLGHIYNRLGLLSKGQLVEVDKSGLVAGYIGQTAIKTQKVIEESMGGILFIDEAYSLVAEGTGGFGKEAIDTLLKAMEDNRDNFIVIVAGYSNLMDGFLKSNPGLQSRFNNFIHFEDYDAEQLYEIFVGICKKYRYIVEPSSIDYLKQHFADLYKNRGENYANARDVRNFFEKALRKQANRLASYGDLTNDELLTITKEDLFGVGEKKQKPDEYDMQNYFWNELQKQLKNKGYNIYTRDFSKDVSKYYKKAKNRHRWFGFEFGIYKNANFKISIDDHFYYGFTPNNKQFVELVLKISSLFKENERWSGWKHSDKFDLDFWNLNSAGFEQLSDADKRENFIKGLASEIDLYIKEFIKKAKESGI
jgi:SpoVK/Ycf46/Vps4 family AAA+-type ATPase